MEYHFFCIFNLIFRCGFFRTLSSSINEVIVEQPDHIIWMSNSSKESSYL